MKRSLLFTMFLLICCSIQAQTPPNTPPTAKEEKPAEKNEVEDFNTTRTNKERRSKSKTSPSQPTPPGSEQPADSTGIAKPEQPAKPQKKP